LKRFVNGDEVELSEGTTEVSSVGDRLIVRTPDGAYSAVAVRTGDSVLVSYRGRQYKVERKNVPGSGAGGVASGDLRAPMPGLIVDVRVAVGDSVTKGQVLVVLEAMKTQQPFAASFDGVVKTLGVAKGDQVNDGTLLVSVVANEAAA